VPRSDLRPVTTTADGDDYYVRMHRAREHFLAYQLRGNAWRIGMQLIEACIASRQKGLWIACVQDFANATCLKVPALRRTLRKLETHGVLRRDDWIQVCWYEIRPHQEWRPTMTRYAWWRWARATVKVRKSNPAALSAYRDEWCEIAGEEAAKHSAPVQRVGRTLKIACDRQTWRKRLGQSTRRNGLVRRVHARFREISKIEFFVGGTSIGMNQ
jgi:hypothetical protein